MVIIMVNFAEKSAHMKIGIIVAMEKELQLLLPVIEDPRQIIDMDTSAYSGRIGNHDVIVMKSGIGKVNSALVTDALIREFSPELIVNTGVAGGADKSMRVLDLFVADKVAYHDVWCGPGTLPGAAAGFDVFMKADERVVKAARSLTSSKKLKIGLICSGDRFISEETEVKAIKRIFSDCLAVDMESASIAQVCTLRSVPFAIIRAISDTPGQAENISQYENFWTDAPAETFDALISIIKTL